MESASQLSDRLRTILRRDLKVAAHVVIDDDTPLFGGHTDLDSLDALLLVTSIEKEFKIKIPNESIGREAFRSIRTLSGFLEGHLAGPAAAPGTKPADMAGADALARLPHGEPFRFVTRVTALAPGQTGEGVWTIAGQEPFFAGHFPGDPIVPGVLIAEALAQMSGIVGASAAGGATPRAGRVAHMDIRFRSLVRPPVDLVLFSRLLRRVDSLVHFEVRATVERQVVAEGSVTMGLE